MPKATNTSYKGNANLKRAGTTQRWTKSMIEEFAKCQVDPIYFAETHFKIVNLDRGLITIKLFDFQKEIIESIKDNRYTIVNTGRQMGKTTTASIILLHYVIFNNYKTVGLVANKEDTAKEILDRMKIAYQELPMWMQQGIVEWNKKKVILENGSKVLTGSSSSSSIRGRSINILYCDETAHIEGWDEFAKSVMLTITSGETTKVLLTSTPNGLNHFYKFWVEAEKKVNNYHPIKVPWHRYPGRTQKWKKDIIATECNGDLDAFNQEFNCEFVGSSNTLLAGATLKALVAQNPIREGSGINQYEEPQEMHLYVMICDVSRGKGLDYSAFSVIDVTKMPYKQVCVYRSNMILPAEYAGVIYHMARKYNNAYTLIECNDIGEQVTELLYFDYEYEYILYTESKGRTGKVITGGFGRTVDKGIKTTKTVKIVGCSLLKILIEQEQLILNDFETISELSTFVQQGKGNAYAADKGKHDDLAMTLVLFAWLSDEQFFKDITDINTIGSIREKTEAELIADLMPFGFINNGLDDYDGGTIIDENDNTVWKSSNGLAAR